MITCILKKLTIGKSKSWIHGKEIAYVDPSSGTPYSREQIWKAATAALYGLGPDSVPDDGFAYLGKYAQHWWKRAKATITQKNNPVSENILMYRNSDFGSTDLLYSSKIDIDTDGNVYLISPSTMRVDRDNLSDESTRNIFRGKYVSDVYMRENDVFLLSSTEIPFTDTGNGAFIRKEAASIISVAMSLQNSFDFIQSSEKYAYPNNGLKDGYYYQYLGIPFDNAAADLRIVTGSYVGTGKYGAENPNILLLDFPPKIVWIHTVEYSGRFSQCNMVLSDILNIRKSKPLSYSTERTSYDIQEVTFSGNKVSWYSHHSSDQQNSSECRYYYLVIG